MLKLENLCFVADDGGTKKTIIKNVTLTLDEKLVAFTGPNGSGKSTLAKLIMGIYKPTSGRIYFNGKDITDLSITDRANAGIGFAFQQPVRFKGITVKDLISLASGKKLSVSEICAHLSEVGLCARDYVNREINASLSGGELKRIEIAVAMARNSALTLFDEPEAGIDLWSFNNLIAAFERLFKRADGNVIIISHQERILNVADRIIVLKDGEVCLDGKKEDVLPKILSVSACAALNKGN